MQLFSTAAGQEKFFGESSLWLWSGVFGECGADEGDEGASFGLYIPLNSASTT